MKKKWYLLSYDIRNEKRLKKFHYRIKKQALAVQKSVFLIEGHHADIEKIITLVNNYTNTHEDDVRLYAISHPNAIWSAGIQHQVFDNKGLSSSSKKAEKFIQSIKNLFKVYA